MSEWKKVSESDKENAGDASVSPHEQASDAVEGAEHPVDVGGEVPTEPHETSPGGFAKSAVDNQTDKTSVVAHSSASLNPGARDEMLRARDMLGAIEKKRFEAWTRPEELQVRLGEHLQIIVDRVAESMFSNYKMIHVRDILDQVNDGVPQHERLKADDIHDFAALIQDFITQEATLLVEKDAKNEKVQKAKGTSRWRRFGKAAGVAGATIGASVGASVVASATLGIPLIGLGAVALTRMGLAGLDYARKKGAVRKVSESIMAEMTTRGEGEGDNKQGLSDEMRDNLLLALSDRMRQKFREAETTKDLAKARAAHAKAAVSGDLSKQKDYEHHVAQVMRKRLDAVKEALGSEHREKYGIATNQEADNALRAMTALMAADERGLLVEEQTRGFMDSRGWLSKALDKFSIQRKDSRVGFIGAMFVGGALLRHVDAGAVKGAVGGMMAGEALQEAFGKKEETGVTLETVRQSKRDVENVRNALISRNTADMSLDDMSRVLDEAQLQIEAGSTMPGADVAAMVRALRIMVAESRDMIALEQFMQERDDEIKIEGLKDTYDALKKYREATTKNQRRKNRARAIGFVVGGLTLGVASHFMAGEAAAADKVDTKTPDNIDSLPHSGVSADASGDSTSVNIPPGSSVHVIHDAVSTDAMHRDVSADMAAPEESPADTVHIAPSDVAQDHTAQASGDPALTAPAPQGPGEETGAPLTESSDAITESHDAVQAANIDAPHEGDAYDPDHLNDAVVHKGEGIWHALRRQLIRRVEDNPEGSGFTGDPHNAAEVKAWADGEVAKITADPRNAYITHDTEVRVGEADKYAYVLQGDGTVSEVEVAQDANGDYTVVGDAHNAGTVDGYEYTTKIGDVEVSKSLVDNVRQQIERGGPVHVSGHEDTLRTAIGQSGGNPDAWTYVSDPETDATWAMPPEPEEAFRGGNFDKSFAVPELENDAETPEVLTQEAYDQEAEKLLDAYHAAKDPDAFESSRTAIADFADEHPEAAFDAATQSPTEIGDIAQGAHIDKLNTLFHYTGSGSAIEDPRAVHEAILATMKTIMPEEDARIFAFTVGDTDPATGTVNLETSDILPFMHPKPNKGFDLDRFIQAKDAFYHELAKDHDLPKDYDWHPRHPLGLTGTVSSPDRTDDIMLIRRQPGSANLFEVLDNGRYVRNVDRDVLEPWLRPPAE